MATVSLPKEKSYIYIIGLIWLVILIFLMLSAVTIFRNRTLYINTSHTKSKAQAQLLGENTSSVLYSVDLTLLSIRSRIKHQIKSDRIVPETIAKIIKDQSMFLPQINNIVLFNAENKAIHSLRTFQIFNLTAFEEHQDAWLDFSINTVFSKENKKLIVMSRRVENMAGEFVGVLAATIDPIFFYDRYEGYLNIDVDAVVLLDAQRNVLTHWNSNPDFETLHAENFLLSSVAPIEGGGLRTHENSEAIISIYQLPDFPFQISVLHQKDSVLKQWYQKTKQDLAIITATVLIGIITMILAFGQRKKREKAEQNLIEHQNHLEGIVEKRTLNLKKANTELQEALEEIKTLKGIVPICSTCKKIRDDQGYWNLLETYIEKHSEASFSHGICPGCSDKLYGDKNWYIDMKKKKNEKREC